MFSPIDISREAKNRGVTIDEYPYEHLHGCVFRNGNRHHVVVSDKLDPIYQRMTVAHELCHIDDDSIDSVHVFIAERRAYRMARAKLVPENSLRELLEDGLCEYSTLASLFGVSEKMIQLRCQDLSIF